MAGMTMAFEKGMQLAEEGQFADAIACFRKAIAEGLETPEVFECLAQCEMMLDTLSSSQRAVVAAQEALQRLGAEEAPGRLSWVDATLTLARALRCNFDLPAAVDAYHAAVRLGASAPAELQSAEEELLEHRRRLKRLPSMEGWHRRFQRQIDRAKRLRRPEWSAEKWRSNNLAAMDLTQIFGRGKGNITRVTGSADFGALYQGTSTPVVLVGAMHGWAA
ncbi:Bifunctional arginine demethylase and lysyl-hydroxylase JMJD6-B, partial [Durusdinium trenchii]